MEVMSCQITGIRKDYWIRFRQKCIEDGISVNRKMKLLIEAEVDRYKHIEESNKDNEKVRNNG